MPLYQFLLHSTGFTLEMGDGGPPAVGFYTSLRARAQNSKEAYKIVMAAMDDDPKLANIFASGHSAGLHPKTEVEATYIIPWWRGILPWRKPGLAFYREESEGECSEGFGDLPGSPKINLRCQHCGELIVARGFGKCPGCYRDLPENLQLSPREMEHEEMEEKWRKMDERTREGGDSGMGGSSL